MRRECETQVLTESAEKNHFQLESLIKLIIMILKKWTGGGKRKKRL
jgi:hypothetical protein